MNRAIIESAGVGIVTVSRHGTITSFNRAAESILGYAAADLVGKERVSILLEASRLQKEAEEMSRHYGEEVKGMGVFLRPLRDEPSYTREWKFRAKDGAPVTVSLTLSILRDEEGRESGYLAVMRDLTATRLREREAKNLIRAADIVQQTQEDFITGVARDSLFSRLLGRILSFTRGEFGFIGEVLRDAQGMPYLKTHSISNIAWDEESRTLYEENRATGFEFHNMETLFGLVMTSGEMVISNDPANDPRRGGVPPGHPAMHSFLGLPLYYGGQIVGMLGLANRPGGFNEGVVRKVQPLASSCALLIQAVRLENERLEAQRALEQQEKRLRLIIETEADCFVEVGADGLVKEWNLYAERQLQVPRHEALGRPIDAIVTFQEADGRPTSLTDYDTGTHESRESSREVTAVRRDGSVFPAELVTWALATDDSRSFCAFIRDIGPRKELELQQRMRFQSETLLKEVHHRIKNNMQVISSLLSIQSSKLADEEQRQVFLECRERIRAMSLIHDRLYSTGDYEHIDFGDYLRQMVSLITSSNCPSGTSVKLDVEVQSVVVAVEDAVPLSLIAAELVLNSLKHGFRGRTEGVMTVRLRQTDGLCDLFIGDDGPGLPGEAPDGGAGSGLQLIDALTRQIRGTREHGAAGTSIRWKA